MVLKMVITGAECTGKTTLGKALAEHEQTYYLPEYARQYADEKGGDLTYADVLPIAEGQLHSEQKANSAKASHVFLDTNLFNTIFYSEFYYGKCPIQVKEWFASQHYDVYFLLDMHIPWVEERGQRSSLRNRALQQAQLTSMLDEARIAYHRIQGSVEQRLAQVIDMLTHCQAPLL